MKSINQELAIAGITHCEKLTWMLIHHKEDLKTIEQQLTIEEGRKDVIKAARKMFAERNILNLEKEELFALRCLNTEEAIESHKKEYISGAAFAVDDLISCPEYIRVHEDGSIGLFVIHMCLEGEEDSKTAAQKTKYAEDIAKLSFQYYVLNQLGYKVSSTTIYYVNKKYLKTSQRHAYNEFFEAKDVFESVLENQTAMKANLETIRSLMKEETEPPCRFLEADRCINNPCPCFDICNEEKNATNSIVWKIAGLFKKKKCYLVNSGFTTPYQVEDAHYNGTMVLNAKQLRQLQFHINNSEPYIEKENLEKWFTDVFENKKTIVFFDFESYMYVLPRFQNLQPYTQLPFQWSAHVLDVERREITHHEFLAAKGKDPREACINKMLKLPRGEDVVWIAYNMGFEKGVIGKLAETYPEYAEELMEIRESFEDLMVPFKYHMIYMNEFQGSYSIKYVLPAIFPNSERLNYSNLTEIRNGVDAQRGYLLMQKKKGEELEALKKNMLRYCELDTWAMVMLYAYIGELIANNYATTYIPEDELKTVFKTA